MTLHPIASIAQLPLRYVPLGAIRVTMLGSYVDVTLHHGHPPPTTTPARYVNGNDAIA